MEYSRLLALATVQLLKIYCTPPLLSRNFGIAAIHNLSDVLFYLQCKYILL